MREDDLLESLRFFETRFAQVHADHVAAYRPENEDYFDASAISQKVLPDDDSSLQWSRPGGGLTDDPEKSLQDIYRRMVTE